jgi:hypothetical protein
MNPAADHHVFKLPSGVCSPQAFRWTSTGMIGLGFLPGGSQSIADAVNADGSVIVGLSDGNPFVGGAARWTSTLRPAKWSASKLPPTLERQFAHPREYEYTAYHYFGRFLAAPGFPNQFFCDSWVVGFWRADHGWQDIGLEG